MTDKSDDDQLQLILDMLRSIRAAAWMGVGMIAALIFFGRMP